MPTFSTPIDDATCQSLIQQPKIGRGGARAAFSVKGEPSVIIKEVYLQFIGANVLEWFIWNEMKGGPLAHRFGECLTISNSARYLIMERLDDISAADYKSTPTMPNWLNDLKPSNFGKSGSGQIKLCDYATVKLGGVLAAAPGYRWAWQL